MRVREPAAEIPTLNTEHAKGKDLVKSGDPGGI
jgi:hypothetical protein